MTGDMEDMVVPDIMNDVFLAQGRYPENFVLICQSEMCQEGGIKKGGTWRTLRVPDQRLGGMVIPEVLNDVLLTQGRYPENFVFISQLEVCQNGESRRGVLGGH